MQDSTKGIYDCRLGGGCRKCTPASEIHELVCIFTLCSGCMMIICPGDNTRQRRLHGREAYGTPDGSCAEPDCTHGLTARACVRPHLPRRFYARPPPLRQCKFANWFAGTVSLPSGLSQMLLRVVSELKMKLVHQPPSLPPFHLLPSVSISVFAAMSRGMPRIEVELRSPIKVDPSIPRARWFLWEEGRVKVKWLQITTDQSNDRSVDRHMRRSHTSACLVFAPYVLTAHPLSCARGAGGEREARNAQIPTNRLSHAE